MTGRIKREGVRSMKVPIIGKIKAGRKTSSGRPESLDHFIASGKYSGLFDQEYNKPDSIQIAFISDRIEDVCREEYEIRDEKGRRWGYGDGEAFQVWNEKKELYETYFKGEHPDIMPRVEAKVGRQWRATLTLVFVIPAIRGVIGQWQFSTKGAETSIPQIRDSFDFVLERAGTVVNVPFDLQVEKVKSQKPGKKSVYPIVKLVPNISQKALETVAAFLEAGHSVNDLPGMLTEETVSQMPLLDSHEDAEIDVDPPEWMTHA